ncbi:glucosamine-6-phosphate deaminase [Antarcticibacterium flavum]|uniref:Glucosamine-6-phosphate deaminase n=1 Tax=Antarcticibacterium flavum TaxID=2058175 RepID=A0A5B7X4N8_9FLAO|nr:MULTISPECIES: glucosamine-6-phosphate deaminase [Antarcticibacterium]MCM4160097.1 glucosamine-6-phosphate deaminase [Antarcticibacterium sp. W02-3]QCY69652.1 glucosamine-6-phosphate deaminase [Antarcticibacterium flavum]
MPVLNFLEETRYEKLSVEVFPDKIKASQRVAREISQIIITKNSIGKKTVLGLATGATPLPLYEELIRMHNEEGLSFKNVITFNLDEYFPMQPTSHQSYVSFMHKNLFDHIDIKRENVHIPDGTLQKEKIADYCRQYEKLIEEVGGLDLQILGIGRTGHVGFNEPGSAPNSGSRLVTLDDLTRRDAARDFGGKENVPTKAITMGIGTILKARKIILMAWSGKKSSIIKKAVEGEISSSVPATFLQYSNKVKIVLDKEAASELTRYDIPWLVKDCLWNEQLIKKAVIWLSSKIEKPILKLTDEDYNNNGMAQLVTEQGPAYNINIQVFNTLQHTITGWPGGKPNSDDSQRPERALPTKKRSLIFSPHPDDDVISMGGTLIRLVDQGHDVHIAYQTSGNTAVWDRDVLRYMEFAIDFNKSIGENTCELTSIYDRTRKFLSQKKPNEIDPYEIQNVKAFIRKSEAYAAARYAGVQDSNIHFLELPFYDRGKTVNNPSKEEDILITMEILQKIKPHQVFTAGDFEDPHGTHIVCFEIVLEALKRLNNKETWTKDCWLWLYRGAWLEFKTHDIEMAVPLSPQEVELKRNAIFQHQSQKDKPVFPGDDEREFWLRAQERNRETARSYHELGLANYEAMEAFVKWEFH